jgi:hypothetical protein
MSTPRLFTLVRNLRKINPAKLKRFSTAVSQHSAFTNVIGAGLHDWRALAFDEVNH